MSIASINLPMALGMTAGLGTANTALTGLSRMEQLGQGCFVDDGNGQPAGGVAAQLQAPRSFMVRPSWRPVVTTKPGVRTAMTGRAFQKQFGVPKAAFYRSAQGLASEPEAAKVEDLIASHQVLQVYHAQLKQSIADKAKNTEVFNYLQAVSFGDLVNFLFDPQNQNKKISFEAFKMIVQGKLFNDDRRMAIMTQPGNTVNIFDIMAIFQKKAHAFFKAIMKRLPKSKMPYITIADLVIFLMALETDIKAMGQVMKPLAQAIAAEKARLQAQGGRGNINQRTLAAYEAGALEPGLALEVKESLEAYPLLKVELAKIILDNAMIDFDDLD